jgi:hypothetical protein
MNNMWIYPRPSWLEKGVQPASHGSGALTGHPAVQARDTSTFCLRHRFLDWIWTADNLSLWNFTWPWVETAKFNCVFTGLEFFTGRLDSLHTVVPWIQNLAWYNSGIGIEHLQTGLVKFPFIRCAVWIQLCIALERYSLRRSSNW